METQLLMYLLFEHSSPRRNEQDRFTIPAIFLWANWFSKILFNKEKLWEDTMSHARDQELGAQMFPEWTRIHRR